MSGAGEPAAGAADRVARLVGLFADDPATFGRVVPLPARDVPEPFRSLLDHSSHMTVAMERHHGGPVALRVVAVCDRPGAAYAREILLLGPDGRVVQYGIVRIDLDSVGAATAARIRAGDEPLGRILIDAGVLCAVGDVTLVAIDPGPHLVALLGAAPTFGRTAAIAIDGGPAVELLEVVAAG